MIKVEKVFPMADTDHGTITQLAEDMLPGAMYHCVIRKGKENPALKRKAGTIMIYVLKGDLEFLVTDGTGRKIDFRAEDGMLVKVPPGVTISFKAIKETSFLYGTDISGKGQADQNDISPGIQKVA